MVLSCGLVYECIVCQSRHVVKMQYLLHKVFRSRYFSPYCHYREFALSHDTPAPPVAGVALGGGGPHGHSGNIKVEDQGKAQLNPPYQHERPLLVGVPGPGEQRVVRVVQV